MEIRVSLVYSRAVICTCIFRCVVEVIDFFLFPWPGGTMEIRVSLVHSRAVNVLISFVVLLK